jgi:hypothetical protein
MNSAKGGIHAHQSGVVNGEALIGVELLGLDRFLSAPFHIANVRGQMAIEQCKWVDFSGGSPNVNLKNSHRSGKGVPWSS